MPLLALLDQFAPDFPGFCKVGTGHNKKIDFDAKGFIAVRDSVGLLQHIRFDSSFVDEAHHPLPPELPWSKELYRFSATHKDEPDFRYTMGEAIEDGVLCDYDITVPALTAHHAYVCLADLLLKKAGVFRRVLAYCNSVAEAKRFRRVLQELGLAAWHINSRTTSKKRTAVLQEFAAALQKPVHILVTVEVLGEGINIPNADTCMFVEPRNSYRSIIQAIGRVLRHHPAKTLAHIVLPAVAMPSSTLVPLSPAGGTDTTKFQQPPDQPTFKGATQATHVAISKPDFLASSDQETKFYNPDAEQFSQKTAHSKDQSLASNWDRQTEVLRRTGRRSGFLNIEVEMHQGSTSSIPEVGPRLSSLGEIDLAAKLGVFAKRQGRGAGSTGRADGQQKSGQRRKQQEHPTIVFQNASNSGLTNLRGSSHAKSQVNPTAHMDLDGKHIGDAGADFQNRHMSHDEPSIRGPFGKGILEVDKTPPQKLPEAQESGGEGVGPCRPPKQANIHPEQLSLHHQSLALDAQELLSAMHENPNPEVLSPGHATSQTCATPRPARRSFSLKPSSPSLVFDQQYNSQLERFLATLMLADHRLASATAWHRIQIADCTLAGMGANMMDWTREVYGQLCTILSETDPWANRLGDLEAFVAKHGRLPTCSEDEEVARSLAVWLRNQGFHMKKQGLQSHRLHKLLTSSPLIRKRAEGWLTGDPDRRFKEKCQVLRDYVELHKRLPKSTGGPNAASSKLAEWLANVRKQRWQLSLNPYQVRMLQEVHPLVKAEVKRWQNIPLSMDRPRWEQRLEELSSFVSASGCLPKFNPTSKAERRCYNWFRVERRRLQTGSLPNELAQKLQNAHPLIAALVDALVQKQNTCAIASLA